MLGRFAHTITLLAGALGGPGLAILAFVDSSSVPLPNVVDALLVGLTIAHPGRWALYAGMATMGSVAGCQVLYVLARKGGEAFLRKRFHERHVDKAFARFRRYGLLAVTVPAILPPPAPFKLFIMLAGAAEVSPVTFAMAAALGRGFRYFSEALLARLYGDAAMGFIHDHLPQVSLWLAATVLGVGLIITLWRRRRTA
jgi:membrane protein YqaA with SNARE-associated domain